MKHHSGGSHNAQATPDKKMGKFQWPNVKSSVKKAAKRAAAKKRRQRSRSISKTHDEK